MEGTTQTFLAVGVGILTAALTLFFYSGAPILFDLPNWPSNLVLLVIPCIAFVLCFAYLNLSELSKPKDKQASLASIAKSSVVPFLSTSAFLLLSFFIPFFSSVVISAVPNVFELSPQQLLLAAQTMPKEALDMQLASTSQKQGVLDYGVAYAYYAFWGSLFGTMIAMTIL